jgi:hypothetical protein
LQSRINAASASHRQAPPRRLSKSHLSGDTLGHPPQYNQFAVGLRDAHQFEFVHTPEVSALEVVDHELPQSFGRMLCVEPPCCGKPREVTVSRNPA